jgi:hypothetical protein
MVGLLLALPAWVALAVVDLRAVVDAAAVHVVAVVLAARAEVGRLLAVLELPLRRAHARVVVELVDACAAVEAGTGGTLVDVEVALAADHDRAGLVVPRPEDVVLVADAVCVAAQAGAAELVEGHLEVYAGGRAKVGEDEVELLPVAVDLARDRVEHTQAGRRPALHGHRGLPGQSGRDGELPDDRVTGLRGRVRVHPEGGAVLSLDAVLQIANHVF